MTKRKTTFLITVMFLFISVFVPYMFMGCSNEKDFIEVSSVTFTSGNETNTLYSTWYITTGTYEVATMDEYNNAEFKESLGRILAENVDVDSISGLTRDCFNGQINNIDSIPFNPYNISDDDIDKYFYFNVYNFDLSKSYYFKTKITGVGASLVKVKVIDYSTIIINKNGIETTYIVTSYSLKK